MKNILIRFSQYVIYFVLSFIVLTSVGLIVGEPTAHALPEYVNRTGEPCSTCHVNPGGGGPRTLQGLLWAAQGRPEEIPQLENLLIAPGIEDGIELYDIACASCHGFEGEGVFGRRLAGSGIDINQMRSAILRGRERSGMPSFENKFTDEQLEALLEYVTGIATGVIKPAPVSYPLPPGKLECVNNPEIIRCGGN